MKEYIYRMQNERGALDKKLINLKLYLENYGKNLNYAERYLMKQQQECMTKYLDILNARIEAALIKEGHSTDDDFRHSFPERLEVEWIDVNEYVPQDDYEVLVLVKSYEYNNYYYAIGDYYNGLWNWKDIYDINDYVVVWAELPKAPAAYDKLAHQQ